MNDTAIKILAAETAKTHLFFIGQAGFIIKSSRGQLLGFDLCLSECVERVEGHMGFKRLIPMKVSVVYSKIYEYLIAGISIFVIGYLINIFGIVTKRIRKQQ